MFVGDHSHIPTSRETPFPGVGTGWITEQMRNNGVDPGTRGARLDEHLRARSTRSGPGTRPSSTAPISTSTRSSPGPSRYAGQGADQVVLYLPTLPADDVLTVLDAMVKIAEQYR
jgi:hypothetical protein